ncbi:MAG TPA: type I 3-dehydroquinate dehydratase [Bacillus bacterium]|uniref:3-dehydroquinate dehydratase n=1 Tax=Siminovitchia fordii TaxID=254759 RepID=A0ABQ4K471_9BACI|nr:type I 3-dehydroquinate dehydratase [Siminovitchia fordii]GIN19967.1 3-dehydroquinate dehydratase [Siminovitchia fordii]HBZ08988.1 type I 3-dehydroquinate dehydratase [Bacillus sp. (in: firmicutes)]
MIEVFKEKKLPYICTPLTGKNKEEIMNQLNLALPEKPDLIEWRADFLQQLDDLRYVLSVLEAIVEKSDLPLLFTIRSIHEGGQQISLTEEQKVRLISEVCKNDAISMIDYEVSSNSGYIKELRKISQKYGKKLILSYHNFNCTPSEEDIMKKLLLAEFYGADIAKAAVMPNTKDDVLKLLNVTNNADKTLDIPLITMSMGSLGAITRIVGFWYGSFITFGSGVEASAPGQVPIRKLKQMIAMMKEEMDIE